MADENKTKETKTPARNVEQARTTVKREPTPTATETRPQTRKERYEEVQANQPKFDENGVQIENNVFPPVDEDVEFNGTGAGQRQLRRAREAAETNKDE